jgi:hypothetical protein
MSGYKGRASTKANETKFPHHVDMLVPEGGFGDRLNAMHDYHVRGISAVHDQGGRDPMVFYRSRSESSRKSSKALSASRHKVRTTTPAEHSADSAVCFVTTQAFGLSDREACMNGIIYLIGLIVVIMAILSFLGLR